MDARTVETLFMNKIVLKLICCSCLSAFLVLPYVAYSATIDSVVATELSGIKKAKSSQKRIDAIYARTEKARSAARVNTKVVKGLVAYNTRLNKTVLAQNKALEELRSSIQKASAIERQILPLIVRMLDSIDQFIAKDVPFLKQRRLASQENIRSYMSNTKVPVSERFRLVLDTYGREIAHGRTIEAYSDSISYEGKSLEVDVLKVGRVGLYFQTKDTLVSGVWSQAELKWIPLADKYKQRIRRAIRIAQQKESPDLLKDLPLLVNNATQ